MRMYSDFFGIRENAFAITPDPRYLFMSERHREALAHLLFGTEEGGGFVQLTGEVGTGKTTICRAFLEQLPENVDVALLLNPPDNGRELLLAIISELRLPVPRHNAQVRELVELLNEHLLRAHASGRRTVVIIDEAQNIKDGVLEQVRLLTNLETPTHKLLQVFLIGQPELRQKLKQPSLRQVAQRITARYHLEPLSLAETRGYIKHRLAVAGCRQGLFNSAAVKQIYLQSQGIPRVINILCDRALIGAFATDSTVVNAAIVRHAAKEWRGGTGREHLSFPLARPAIAVAVAALVVAAAVGYVGYGGKHPAENFSSLLNAGAGAVGDPDRRGESPPESIPSGMGETAGHSENPGGSDPTSSAEPRALNGSGITTQSAQQSNALWLQPVSMRTTTVQPNQGQKPLADAVLEIETVSVSSAMKTGVPVALQALLARWGIHNNQVALSALCDEVVHHGLQCLHEKGGWDLLRRYNRPALLTMKKEHGEGGTLALVEMNKEHAIVATSDGPRKVSYQEMESYWDGEFVILWRPPLEGVSLITEGSAQWAVKWLTEALRRFDGKDYPVTVFDRDTQQRLRNFQQSQGLVADGIAGPRTFIHLNTLSGKGDFPMLIAQNTY